MAVGYTFRKETFLRESSIFFGHFSEKMQIYYMGQIKAWNNREDKKRGGHQKNREKNKTVAQKQSGRERYYWEGNVFRPWFHQICFNC